MITCSIYYIWFFFFNVNYITSYIKDITRKQILVKENNKTPISIEGATIKMSILVLLISALKTILLKTIAGYVFFDQLIVINATYWLFLLMASSYLAVSVKMLISWLSKIKIPSDYTCTNLTFFLLAPILSLTANLYSFFLIIELLGICILAKFSFLPLGYSSKTNSKGIVLSTPKPLVVSIFTYYWMGFFSSIFLAFYLVIMMYAWGTTDYYELTNLLYFSDKITMSISSYFYSILSSFFILGFLLKAGAAPFHTYKMHMFRGLPLFSVIIYTSLFYVTYLVYFAYLIPVIILSSFDLGAIVIMVVTVLGIVYLTNDLFTNKHLKTFFALSSALNATTLIFLLLSI